jgi:hypothetical protein
MVEYNNTSIVVSISVYLYSAAALALSKLAWLTRSFSLAWFM